MKEVCCSQSVRSRWTKDKRPLTALRRPGFHSRRIARHSSEIAIMQPIQHLLFLRDTREHSLIAFSHDRCMLMVFSEAQEYHTPETARYSAI